MIVYEITDFCFYSIVENDVRENSIVYINPSNHRIPLEKYILHFVEEEKNS